MNKRKLKRAKQKKEGGLTKANDKIISLAAASTVQAALQNKATMNSLGNFIFFSTASGEGWMLDHRRNLALRLAEDGEALDYTILESKERFQVEWKERFRLEDDKFIASFKDKETVFTDYPVEALALRIENMKAGLKKIN